MFRLGREHLQLQDLRQGLDGEPTPENSGEKLSTCWYADWRFKVGCGAGTGLVVYVVFLINGPSSVSPGSAVPS